MRPVGLKIPIRAEDTEFAELAVTAVLATKDYRLDMDRVWPFGRVLPWVLPDKISFSGSLGAEDIDTYMTKGRSGSCAPVALKVWSLPNGFWQNDYFQSGVLLPAPYAMSREASVTCFNDHVDITTGDVAVGSWSVWHDRWTPLYPKGGATRCGMLTELAEKELSDAQARHGLSLGWVAELSIWKRESEYGEFKLTRQRGFYLE